MGTGSRIRWQALDTRVSLGFLVLAVVAPLFAPLWWRANLPEIERDYTWITTQRGFVAAHGSAEGHDPWGNPWKGSGSYCYSTGPDGIDQSGGGDDVACYHASLAGIVARQTSLVLSVYQRAPLDYLVGLVLLFGTWVTARQPPRHGSGLGELVLSVGLGAPLALGLLLELYAFRLDPRLQALGEAWALPLPVVLTVSVVGFTTLLAYALRGLTIDRVARVDAPRLGEAQDELGIGPILEVLPDSSLHDLGAAYGLEPDQNRAALLAALVRSPAEANEILEDLLDADELQLVARGLQLQRVEGEALIPTIRAKVAELQPLPAAEPETIAWRVELGLSLALMTPITVSLFSALYESPIYDDFAPALVARLWVPLPLAFVGSILLAHTLVAVLRRPPSDGAST